MSGVAKKYQYLDGTDQAVYMSVSDAVELSKGLAEKIRLLGPLPDLLVGLANGGLLPTKVIADELQLPFEIIRVRHKSSRLKQRLGRLLRTFMVPADFLQLTPINWLNKTFNRRFDTIEHESFSLSVRDINVMIVDDCMDSGRSVMEVRSRLLNDGAAGVRVSIIAWGNKPWKVLPDQIPPDLYMHRGIHFFPWANNSPHYVEFITWLRQNELELWKH